MSDEQLFDHMKAFMEALGGAAAEASSGEAASAAVENPAEPSPAPEEGEQVDAAPIEVEA